MFAALIVKLKTEAEVTNQELSQHFKAREVTVQKTTPKDATRGLQSLKEECLGICNSCKFHENCIHGFY